MCRHGLGATRRYRLIRTLPAAAPRLFGALVGHLNRAKKGLEADSDLISQQEAAKTRAEQRQAEARAALLEKSKAERLEVRE